VERRRTALLGSGVATAAAKVEVPKDWPTLQVKLPAVVPKMGVTCDPLATPPVPVIGPREVWRPYVEKIDPVCSNMPVPEPLSNITTTGTPKMAMSVNVSTIWIVSVKVAVPMPATSTVAFPELITTSVKGAGPGTMFAVSPESVTVTRSFVNDDAPRVPEAVEERVYVIGSAWTGATEQNKATARPVYKDRVI
jgi:hypothetical protein